MVKIPSFDDLKKMGSGLIDQAKTVNFGEMVDKVKTGIDSVSGKKAPLDISDEALKGLFQGLYAALNEVTQAQVAQINAIKKIETQLETLAKVIEINLKSATPTATPSTQEDKKA